MNLIKKAIKYFNWIEWTIFISSLTLITASFFIFKNNSYLNLIASLIGVTALIFVDKGHPLGQFITIIFACFYAYVSYTFNYYGEMITYIGMTGLIACFSLVVWIMNPSKKKTEVRVNSISQGEIFISFTVMFVISFLFYFILKLLNTTNLLISTIFIFTSLTASYLTLRRSKYYALAYAANDVVLIIMWILASISSSQYISMVICFIFFLINDIYGFINWNKIEKKQALEK